MSLDTGLLGWIEEATGPLGNFSYRRMFGGAACYIDMVVFALIIDDELWLKADRQTEALFAEAGCQRFTYAFRSGKQGSLNYWRAPAETYDDAEAMQHWAVLALEAGQRNRKR